MAGTLSLAAGFGGLSLINEHTSFVFIGVAMVLVGAGVGMTVQNFVLVVQNSVPLSDIGASSATVSSSARWAGRSASPCSAPS